MFSGSRWSNVRSTDTVKGSTSRKWATAKRSKWTFKYDFVSWCTHFKCMLHGIKTYTDTYLITWLLWIFYVLAGGERVQVELLHEFHKDILESRAEERESIKEGWSNKSCSVEGTIPSGSGGNAGAFYSFYDWMFFMSCWRIGWIIIIANIMTCYFILSLTFILNLKWHYVIYLSYSSFICCFVKC